MRAAIYDRLSANIPAGQIHPAWLMAVRAFLYPIEFLRWSLGSMVGYDWRCDLWRVGGVKFTGAALHALAEAKGERFMVTRQGDTVTLVRLDK
jgi:hypothetical protein